MQAYIGRFLLAFALLGLEMLSGTFYLIVFSLAAINLKVAGKYVAAFGNVAQKGNTLILPGNLADLGGMIATAMRAW